jgi:hypothetical protein
MTQIAQSGKIDEEGNRRVLCAKIIKNKGNLSCRTTRCDFRGAGISLRFPTLIHRAPLLIELKGLPIELNYHPA